MCRLLKSLGSMQGLTNCSTRQGDAHAKGDFERQGPYLTGAVSGAAEVAGVVIAVSLMLRLQPSTVVVSNHCPIMFHTADCTILGTAATGLCTSFPCTHLRPAVMRIKQLLFRRILPRKTAIMLHLQSYACRSLLDQVCLE